MRGALLQAIELMTHSLAREGPGDIELPDEEQWKQQEDGSVGTDLRDACRCILEVGRFDCLIFNCSFPFTDCNNNYTETSLFRAPR